MGLVSQGRNCLGDGESLAQEWQMPMWLPCAVRVMGSAGACNCICRLNVSCLGDLMSAERTCRKGLESYLGGGGGVGRSLCATAICGSGRSLAAMMFVN